MRGSTVTLEGTDGLIVRMHGQTDAPKSSNQKPAYFVTLWREFTKRDKKIMLIYQVQIKVNPEVETEWLTWMRTYHIPDMITTGLIQSFQAWKSTDEAHRYHFNYHFASQEILEKYQAEHFPRLKADHESKFAGQFEASRSIFEVI